MRILLFLLLFFWAATENLFAQKFPEHNEPDKNAKTNAPDPAILVHLGYGFHFPGGDLADRFGNAGTLGGGVDFIFKNNFFAGIDGHYLYGTNVKEDPLEPIRTDSGFIIGNDLGIASVVLRERGYYLGGQVGKIFTFGGQKRAGLRVTVGGGWLLHKIRVQDDARSLTQITGDYGKGYDRLTSGIALNEFLGYQFLGKSRTVNFFRRF